MSSSRKQDRTEEEFEEPSEGGAAGSKRKITRACEFFKDVILQSFYERGGARRRRFP